MKVTSKFTNDKSQKVKANKHSVIGFFGLTLVFSWGLLLPEITDLPFRLPQVLLIFVGFGPAMAAIIMAVHEQGWPGLWSLLSRLGIIRVGWKWYGLVLLGPWVLFLGALGLAALTGTKIDLSTPTVLELAGSGVNNPWVLLIPAFIYLMITLLGEEIGWRGYALPRLLDKYDELTAGVILGLIWGIWHLPMAWAPSLQAGIIHLPLGWFMADIVGMSVLYVFVFVNTKGSLLIALLLHAVNNLAAMYLPILPPTAPNNQIFFIIMALKWVLVIGIIATKGMAGWQITKRNNS